MSTVIDDLQTQQQDDGGTRRRASAPCTPLPLDGIKVIDFTQVYMGPSCTQMLADYGADVIKVERPGAGDLSRNSFPDKAGQDNPIFLSINRNKRSVSVDTRTDDGKAVLRDLVRRRRRRGQQLPLRRHGADGLRLRGAQGAATRASSGPPAPASATGARTPTRAARTRSPRPTPA